MAVSETLRKVIAPANKPVTIRFDSTDREWATRIMARDWAQGMDREEVLDILQKMLVCWWLKQDPNGSNPALVEGKKITLDLTRADLVRIE